MSYLETQEDGFIDIGLERRPLSEVPFGTLFIMSPNQLGKWFKQHNGVVSPNGAMPTVWGDPLVEICENVEQEPIELAERWRCRNRGRVAIIKALSDGAGDSRPGDLKQRLGWQKDELDQEALGAMTERGYVREGGTNWGLWDMEPSHGYMLTAQGMALAVRKGIHQEFEAGRLRRAMYRIGL